MGCMIRIDPDELSSAASVLQDMAGGLADIGSVVQNACCSCCLPVGIEGQVLAQASSIQSNLGSITEYFGGGVIVQAVTGRRVKPLTRPAVKSRRTASSTGHRDSSSVDGGGG